MARAGDGSYAAPANTVAPAVEGTVIDETDFNALVHDIATALTESVYTAGLGSTDNRLVRTDGTNTKKVQGTGITVDDSDNVSGIAALSLTTLNIGNSDTTLSRTGAGDIAVEGNAVYRAGGTDVPIADGGTGASTATAAFNALSPLTTQGDVLYHNGTNNVRLAPGTAGQVLTSGGAGANPTWGSAGSGDVVGQSSSVDGEIALFSGTGGKTIKRATESGLLKAASGVLSAATAGTDYYAPSGTDVAIADGGTGASSAAAGFRALAEGVGSTQGQMLYRDGSQWTALAPGTAGQVLQTGGSGANPAWATVAGTGDVTAASAFGADNRVVRSDGTGKGVQHTGITVDDSNNMTGVGTVNGTSINVPVAPQGRLTLTSNTPVLSSTVSGATTVYYTPYCGRYVPIYDGSAWTMKDVGGELSQATTDSTKSPAACAADKNYDLFVWSDSGTYRCTRGPAWTASDTPGTGAGSTEIERVVGVWVNKYDITNGPAAQRGTYVGTVRTNASSQVDFVLPTFGAGGSAGKLGVYNEYNRVPLGGSGGDTADSWSYTTASWRTVNGNSGNAISFINGRTSQLIAASHFGMGSTSSLAGAIGIGLNSTSTPNVKGFCFGVGSIVQSTLCLEAYCAAGWNTVYALEYGNTGQSFYGDNGLPQSNMTLSLRYMG